MLPTGHLSVSVTGGRFGDRARREKRVCLSIEQRSQVRIQP